MRYLFYFGIYLLKISNIPLGCYSEGLRCNHRICFSSL